MTNYWALTVGYGTCGACGEELPAQPYRGNPRQFGCEACRVWSYRHPGQTRACGRCVVEPDTRAPQEIRVAQRTARRLANKSRRTA